jgi:hypothetical protein
MSNKPKRDEMRTILVGYYGASKLSVTITPEGSIYLREDFADPYYDADCPQQSLAFSVGMNIRKEYVGELLQILLSCGYKPS